MFAIGYAVCSQIQANLQEDLTLGIVSDLEVLEAGEPAVGFCYSWDVLMLENMMPMMVVYEVTVKCLILS